ncbi:MAG: hypothetical protein K2N09_01770, partial [Muribaculaceae bacterium]|nr:hypothetical protein [Muribaculaceae bacterium]
MYINKNKILALTAGVILALGAAGCQRKNEAKERVQAEREKWEASLPDSLKAVERQTDSIKAELQALNNSFDAMVHSFEYVDNPREVEGYYIAGAWKATYPLKSTGLVARITKSEKLELIAALAGGAHFDRLRIETNGLTAETSVVPHDQALNYRMTDLNTVCFSDSAATSCARLIAENSGNDVKIIYLEGGRQTGSYSYPKQAQSVMMSTWNLYEVSSRIARDERMIPMLAKKGAIISAKIESIKQ